ncbi:hypothetical protein [Streptomyces gardneri]|uniref:Guanylate cyclase domain-containing protein n=1 Tax=Streptomyces gardneri TaxID=66892 RepID=A0A4Y3RNN2_9ACTN|nr:hypothetical protein [Streptomyces gardneri]GEB58914.1 hypothetical protein SGA01_45190 [Streptomyces gardneri]GHG83603.1 hypothetical protein GCM10017674_06180 [Streptomyces gardneri]
MANRPKVSEMMLAFDEHVAEQLKAMPEVEPTEGEIDVSDLYINVPKWRKYAQVSCVFADLAGSTSLRKGRLEASTASIYESAIRPAAVILDEFGADFIDIQGDAAFGLFVGEYSRSRAICAGITIKTFGEQVLVPALQKKWSHEPPETGFKVGCAISDLLGKKIGISGTAHNAPVWAGRAVNYAAKCSQQAIAHEMIVTKPIAEAVRRNEYLYYSCQCADAPVELWKDRLVDKVAETDSAGLLLSSSWCNKCGDAYAEKICSGSWKRPDLDAFRMSGMREQYQKVLKFRDLNARQIRRGING